MGRSPLARLSEVFESLSRVQASWIPNPMQSRLVEIREAEPCVTLCEALQVQSLGG